MKDEEKAKIRAEIIMSLKKGYKPKVTMTAVDLLVQKLAENGILHSSDIAEANELFKQQIIYAHINGFYSPPFGKSRNGEAELYYNETFKNTNK